MQEKALRVELMECQINPGAGYIFFLLLNWIPSLVMPRKTNYYDSLFLKNKYAIHAYTHGPVTGSGSSVVNEQLVAS